MATPTNRMKDVVFNNGDIVIYNYIPNHAPYRYSLCNIKSIEPIIFMNIPRSSGHNHADMLRIVINFNDGQGNVARLDFDIQDVQNQPGWTPNEAGLDQAILDIAQAKAAACGGSTSGMPIDVLGSGLFYRGDYSDDSAIPQANNAPVPSLFVGPTGRLKVDASKTKIQRLSISVSTGIGNYTPGNIIDTDFSVIMGPTLAVSGKITAISAVVDNAGARTPEAEFDILIFSDDPSAFHSGDDTVFDFSADVTKFVGIARFKAADAIPVGQSSVYTSKLDNAIGYGPLLVSQNLFFAIIARNAIPKDGRKIQMCVDYEENFS